MNAEDPNTRLEQFVDRALRAQPPRRAPADFQARVFAEIERRAALPWWHKSFAHWPTAARVAFFVASIGFVKVGLMAAMWAMGPVESVELPTHLPTQLTWLSAVTTSVVLVVRSIPPVWLYGSAALFAAMYAVLFGISAAAYRTLYAGR